MSIRRPDTLGGKAAVVGIGATEFSKNSGRSELKLAVEAVGAALDDAGLTPADVDGLVTFTMDTSPEITVAQAAGIGELSFFSRIHYGGGAACATVQQAALAVASGVADVVVCYRAFNERSGRRFGSGVQRREPTAEGAALGWNLPSGLLTPASWVAMAAQRYLHAYGLGPEVFGHVAVVDRRRGAEPGGVLPREADHARRPRRLPLDRRTAAAAGLLPGDRRRPGPRRHQRGARPRPAPAARRRRGGRARGGPVAGADDELLPGRADRPAGDGCGRPAALAELGSRPGRHRCGHPLRPLHPVRPDAAGGVRFLRSGGGRGVRRGGRAAPEHPWGSAGEAYLHGMNGIAEAVRQIRGTSVNQVAGAARSLVTAGTGVPTSGLILGADG